MTNLTHLERLEAESIDIMREAVSESDRPVMLYSIGRDSAVMLQLAMKAFYPSKPPFPLLHVDTTWKFREMIEFRDRIQPDTRMTGGLYQTGQGRPMARRVRDITGSGKRRPCGARAAPSCQAIRKCYRALHHHAVNRVTRVFFVVFF